MKYVVILGDGMADVPIDKLHGQTPLEYAKTPNIDYIATKSEIGLVHTIPDGMSPGSDTANLSVLGYDPRQYYTGRSPLEAMSIGVDLKETDISLRCNFVTLDESENYEDKIILDHSSGEITTEEAKSLLDEIKKEFDSNEYKFYSGTSYRHLLVWSNGDNRDDYTPPHDILGKQIGDYLPKEKNELLRMMQKSYTILNNHPINIERRKKGLNPANSIWFWGAGTKPNLTPFQDKFGIKGGMVSAVDLLKGIAISAKMDVVNIEGANGTLHTNYKGKVDAAIELLKNGNDFVYIHIEAPDECGHQGNLQDKIRAIELIDEKILSQVMKELEEMDEDYKILILPDHPTPIELRTHTSNPVPYLIYEKKDVEKLSSRLYNEKSAKESNIVIKNGYELMEHFLGL